MTLIDKALELIRKNNGATLRELSEHLYGEVNDHTLERTRNLIALGRKSGQRKLKNVYRLGSRYILVEGQLLEHIQSFYENNHDCSSDP